MAETSTFVGSGVARVSVRPPAIAYTVRPGDRAGLLRAVGYACTEWGGAGQPIVPVRVGARVAGLYEEQIGLLRPDAVIDFAGLPEVERATLERRWETRVIPERSLRSSEPGTPVAIAADLELSHRTMLVPRERASLIATVALGYLIPEQAATWQSTGIRLAHPNGHLELLDAQVDKPSPAGATRWDLTAFESNAFHAPVIVYTDVRMSVAGAIYFWNMRAAGWSGGHHVLWLPLPALDDPVVGQRLRQIALGRSLQSQPDLLLNGSPAADLVSLAERMGFSPKPEDAPLLEYRFGAPPRDPTTEPLTYLVRRHPAQFLFGTRKVGRQVSVPVTVARPRTVIDFQSPFAFKRRGGLVRVDVDDEHFRWPQSPTTARLVEQNGHWTPYGVTLAFQPSDHYRLSLGVPEGAEVATAFLSDHRWSWSLSDKGRYARALDDSIGRARPVVDAQGLAIIRELTSLSRKKAEQAMRTILGDRADAEAAIQAAAGVLPSLVPRWRTAGEIAGDLVARREDTVDALHGLVERRLVRRAFRFACGRCGMETSVAFDRLDEQIRCEGCRALGTLRGPTGSEPLLIYTLSTLLDRVMDQDVLGHLLVEAWASRNRSVIWSVPGADLVSAGGVRREIDVLGLSRQELIVAEVKNRSTGFGGTAVEDAASLAAALGAGRLLLACLDDWADGASATVREAASIWFTGAVDVLGAADLLD